MKTKYDWWRAAVNVMNHNFLGFMASAILLGACIACAMVLVEILLKTFGVIGVIIAGVTIALLTIGGLTYREIKVRGRRYEKY